MYERPPGSTPTQSAESSVSGLAFSGGLVVRAFGDETHEPVGGSFLFQHDTLDVLGRGKLPVCSDRDVTDFSESDGSVSVLTRGVIHVEAFRLIRD